MDDKERETKIDEAIQEILKKGYKIDAGIWGVYYQFCGENWTVYDRENPCCCALSCLLLKQQPEHVASDLVHSPFILTIAKVLQVKPEWVIGFVSGFDGDDEPRGKPSAIKLGTKFREKYVQKKA